MLNRVTLIALVGSLVGANSKNWSAFVVPLVTTAMILFSLFVYRHWEVPAKRKMLDLGRPLLNRLRNVSWRARLFAAATQGARWWRRPAALRLTRGNPED